MVFELKFADVGEGVHEGEILKWHVQPGDTVTDDQLLVEVMTEKVNVEITAPRPGVIQSLGKGEGEVIEVGEVLVTIEVEGSSAPKSPRPSPAEEPKTEEKDDSLFTPSQPFKRVQPKKKREEGTIVNEKPLAAPAVRRRARELGVDLRMVPGSGPGGRISHEDLAQFTGGQTQQTTGTRPTRPSPERVRERTTIQRDPAEREDRIPLRGMRKAISKAMRRSKDHAAHFGYFDEVDMTKLDELRNQAKLIGQEKGVKVTYLPLIIKALIPALKAFPYINASLDEESEEIVLKNYYNIGVAVATDEGLVVPVVKDADQKNVWELSAEIQELAERARAGKLTLDDLSGGTFTITSIGSIGGTNAVPIINHPEVGILGVMKRKLRPVVLEEEGKEPTIVIRPMMNLSLSLDHRVIDGATGAYFMNMLIRYLENPALLLLDN